MTNDAAERLLDKIGDWSVRLSQDPGDWGPEHRLWWAGMLGEALAAERRATVERITANLPDALERMWGDKGIAFRLRQAGISLTDLERAILDAEAAR